MFSCDNLRDCLMYLALFDQQYSHVSSTPPFRIQKLLHVIGRTGEKESMIWKMNGHRLLLRRSVT